MLPDRKESLVEEIKRLPPAEQVVRNAPSCTPVANATQGCTLGTVSLNGSNNNTSHASMQQTNRERRLQYTQSEIEELHNYPSVTFTKREIPSDGGNVAPKGVGEGSKPSRITEGRDKSDGKEEVFLPSAACVPVGTSESGPKIFMSHYAL
ncbi:hypothetical protein KIN20_030557 [Parelaphostrongylus tenuis]|uniref:Uncharacterized protein n=1 Tax=Parelaphostrongylus tenuis TaxID=148309 RepID=A0AAD5WG76_PARTN|nr:hypothetical protein KIN20_030557 [Parelaphostrongylus tenuis]